MWIKSVVVKDSINLVESLVLKPQDADIDVIGQGESFNIDVSFVRLR